MQIAALPGFLGQPEDWDRFSSLPIHPYDLWKQENLLPFNPWADQFNKKHASSQVLMGYSLGGRLALHALLANPAHWRAAIFFSTHPGLTTEEERIQRLQKDLLWKKKFLHSSWEHLIEEWNSQPVFDDGSLPPARKEEGNRLLWAEALDLWSLGRQEDLRQRLSRLSVPILWILGERDVKFIEASASLSFAHPLSKIVVVPKVGHRILWQANKKLVKLIQTFLEGVE